jgi:hypothetical protein
VKDSPVPDSSLEKVVKDPTLIILFYSRSIQRRFVTSKAQILVFSAGRAHQTGGKSSIFFGKARFAAKSTSEVISITRVPLYIIYWWVSPSQLSHLSFG